MTKNLLTWLVLVVTLLATGCSAWVDSKLKRLPPAEDGGMMVTECTTNMECDDMNPCNGIETCDMARSMCESGMPASDGTMCPRPMRPGVCLAGNCVACIRNEDCNNSFSCDGIETCNIATHACESGTLPPAMTPCSVAPMVPAGRCNDALLCCSDMRCCDAAGMCMPL